MGVDVFEGNTGDPATVASQVTKLNEQFGIEFRPRIGEVNNHFRTHGDG